MTRGGVAAIFARAWQPDDDGAPSPPPLPHGPAFGHLGIRRATPWQSKRKGVSADEKKVRLTALIQESGQVWTLKEAEKGGAARGIISQAVKDVLLELVSDDIVREGKVGISTYYWSFKSEQTVKLRTELANLSDEVERLQSQVNELTEARRKQQELVSAASGDAAQAEALESSIQALRERHAGVQQQLQRRENAGASDLHARRKDIGVLRDAANRWTDNCCEIRSQIINNFGLDAKEVGEAARTRSSAAHARRAPGERAPGFSTLVDVRVPPSTQTRSLG